MISVKKRSSRNLYALTVAVVLGITALCCRTSESEIKSRIVKLESDRGSCSGEQIKAPSGDNYIITAAHCRSLETNGSITVVKEDGLKLQRKIIAEDPNSDLLLLEGLPNVEGLDIAKTQYRDQHVRTFTHGRGLPTYKTEGELITVVKIDVPLYQIVNEAGERRCSDPKNSIVDLGGFLGFEYKFCMLNVYETVTIAFIAPGSSGGAVVNSSGEIVGVVSADGDGYGYLVTLSDIHNFLAGY